MKIAFLHMTMGLTNRGSEISLGLLASSLCKKHEVVVLQSGKVTHQKYQQVQVHPLTVAPPTSPQNIFEKILLRLRMDKESKQVVEFTHSCKKYLSEFDPDIVVATNGSLQLKILKSFKLHSKIVCFGRAGIGQHDLMTLRTAPDLFIALSQSAYDWATRYQMSRTKVIYIPNPVSTTRKTPKLKLYLPHPIVLVVGALAKYKNIISVVKAVKDIDYSLLVIGDGEQAGELEKALSDFGGEFRWIKEVDPSEIASFYASADVFCFVPDPQEAFGRVYLEAMTAGLPIVASDDPIRRELIGETGYYVNPHDHIQLKNQIIQAANSAKINYSKQLEPYKTDTIIKQIESAFYELTK